MTTAWQSAIGGGGLAMAVVLIATARGVGKARRIHDALTRRIDDLAARLRAIESRHAPRPTRVDRPARKAEAPALIAVPSLESPGSEAVASEASAELGRRFGSIWAMADAGESPRAIAEATGHPIGQVELILGLRRPQSKSEATPHAR